MSTSTNGQLCYGIQVEDETEPWRNDEFSDYDEIEWWKEVCGWKPPVEIYNDEGNFIDGVEPSAEKIKEYYNAMKKFDEEHPIPVKIVTHCSGEFPMYIVAIKGTYTVNYRGYPKKIDDLTVPEGADQFLKDFCEKHNIPTMSDPAWWLSSYWG